MYIEPELLRFCLVGAGLAVFGTGYNFLVAYLEQRHQEEGWLALLVVVGVAVTLGGVAILDRQAAWLALCGFAASGTPMIVGSLYRHYLASKRLHEAINDDAPNPPA